MTHKVRVPHAVHAQSLRGTHGLKLYVTTMTTSNVCLMCATVFSSLASARAHVVQALRSGRCFVKRSARAHEWEEKVDTEALFFVSWPRVFGSF